MTKFIKTEFNADGEYVTYGPDRKFVARFKYQRGGKGSFITFLIKNFTVEEYFAQYDSGVTPLEILESKGYLQPHIKKTLQENGYEVSVAGKKQYINDLVSKYSTKFKF